MVFPEEEVEGGEFRWEPTTLPPEIRLRHIVAATDLGAGGNLAVTAALDLARRSGAKLSILSVVEVAQNANPRLASEPAGAGWLDMRQEEVRRSIHRTLETLGTPSTLVHVGAGDPPAIVASFVGKFPSSLVVVGAHRLSSFERVLAGSTGERIVQHAGCPVMVATGQRHGPFKRILVAVDLSPSSPYILEYGSQLARIDDAETRVVFSEEPSVALRRALVLPGYRGSRRGMDRLRFEEMVRSSSFSEGVEHVVLEGPAGRAILKEAQRWGASLIVLGARTHRYLSRSRMGRTCRSVLRHGDRSIVVVP
jgi:nucleotide-binding universal stress UspA family protein